MTPTDSTAWDLFKQIAVVGVNLFFYELGQPVTNNIMKKKYLLVSTFIWFYNILYLNGKLSYPLNIFDKRWTHFIVFSLVSCEWEQNKLRDFQILSIVETIKKLLFYLNKTKQIKNMLP